MTNDGESREENEKDNRISQSNLFFRLKRRGTAHSAQIVPEIDFQRSFRLITSSYALQLSDHSVKICLSFPLSLRFPENVSAPFSALPLMALALFSFGPVLKVKIAH